MSLNYERTINSLEFDQKIEAAFNAGLEMGKKFGYSLGHGDAVLERDSFETAPKAVWQICELDCCDAETFATDDEARKLGWEICKGFAFCPQHNG
jgi:hypothetical protein